MTTFSPGDRVRLISIEDPTYFFGLGFATVLEAYSTSSQILMEDGSLCLDGQPWYIDNDCIELANPKEPTAMRLDNTFEHAFREALRTQRQRLEDAGSEYYAKIEMRINREKLTWSASIGHNYETSLTMSGEELIPLIDFLIETYEKKNNLKLRALEAPKAQPQDDEIPF